LSLPNRSGSAYSAPTDADRRPTLIGVNSADGITPEPLEVNTSDGGLIVHVANGGSGGTASSFNATFPTSGTAVGAEYNGNMVALNEDASGNLLVNVAAGGTSGTQYTDGGTPPTHPIGNALVWNNSGTWEAVSAAEPLPVTASLSLSNYAEETGGNLATIATNTTGLNSTITSTGSSVPSDAIYVGFSGVSGHLTGWPGYSLGDASNAVPIVGMRIYNGTNSDSVRSATAAAGTTGTGLLGAGLLGYDGTDWQYTGITSHALNVNISSGSIANTSFAVTNAGTFATQLTGSTNNINNIAGTISLPTGAATSANQTNKSQVTQIADGSGNIIASTSNALNVDVTNSSLAVTGTFYQSTQPVSLATNTPTIATGTNSIGKISDITNVETTIAPGTAPSDAFVIGGVYNSSAPSPTNGQTLALQQDSSGNLNVNIKAGAGSGGTASSFGSTFPATGTAIGAISSGGNMAGLNLDASGYLEVNLKTPIPAGTNAIGSITNTAFTANAGTNLNTSALALETGGNLATIATDIGDLIVAQGSTTSGQVGPLVQTATTTSAPTYTTAKTNPLSTDTSGNLRVSVLNTPAVTLASTTITGSVAVTGTFYQATQPVSGTLTVNTISGFATSANQTNGTQIASIQDLSGNLLQVAQGSTTSGQTAPLVQGATTTSAPSYTTAKTNPLSLDTAGNLRVLVGNASLAVTGTFYQATQPVSLATNTPTLQSGSTTAVTQGTAANLNATVVGTGTFVTQSETEDGSGNAITSNSTTTTSTRGLDLNIRSILNTAPTTAGKLDVIAGNATGVAVPAFGMPMGMQARTTEQATTTSTYNIIPVADKVGKQIVLPYANPENFVAGLATATGTSATAVIAAQGSGLFLYITAISVVNTGATTSLVTIEWDTASAQTAAWYMINPAGGGDNITFPNPLKAPVANKNIGFVCGSSSTTQYVSISGYYGI
jgi:hypothetical protein